MSADILQSHSTSLFVCLQSLYWKRSKFAEFKPYVETLVGSMAQYTEYLRSQNKKMKQAHTSEVPIRQLSDSLSVEVIQKTASFPCFAELSAALEKQETYQHLCLSEFCPTEPQQRYRFLQKIKCGLTCSLIDVLTWK